MRERLWSRRPRAPSLRSIARPQPAGKASKLSCVEAVAATLVIVGLRGRAEQLLAKFKWGPTFLVLNRELFTAYSRCANSAEVVLAQNECIARWESERAGPLMRLPPAGSGSEEESGEEGGEESDEEGAGGLMGRWTHTPKGQAETVGMMPPSESEESEGESAAGSEAGDIDDRSSRPVFVDGGREEKEGEEDDGLVQVFGPKPTRQAPASNLAAVAAAEAAEAAAEAATAVEAAAGPSACVSGGSTCTTSLLGCCPHSARSPPCTRRTGGRGRTTSWRCPPCSSSSRPRAVARAARSSAGATAARSPCARSCCCATRAAIVCSSRWLTSAERSTACGAGMICTKVSE